MAILQPCDPVAEKKALVRQDMLARRQALSPAAAAAAGAAVTERVLALPQWAAARDILLYLSVKNEVDTRALAGQALAEGRGLLLPRCRPDTPGFLDLGRIAALSEARPGRYGIPEPPAERCRPPEAFAPDLILVPGLAFDLTGRRLGFGGGYYDRLLALPAMAQACVVGLAYAFQIVTRLPAESWDRPMDAVVTERTTHRFRV